MVDVGSAVVAEGALVVGDEVELKTFVVVDEAMDVVDDWLSVMVEEDVLNVGLVVEVEGLLVVVVGRELEVEVDGATVVTVEEGTDSVVVEEEAATVVVVGATVVVEEMVALMVEGTEVDEVDTSPVVDV